MVLENPFLFGKDFYVSSTENVIFGEHRQYPGAQPELFSVISVLSVVSSCVSSMQHFDLEILPFFRISPPPEF